MSSSSPSWAAGSTVTSDGTSPAREGGQTVPLLPTTRTPRRAIMKTLRAQAVDRVKRIEGSLYALRSSRAVASEAGVAGDGSYRIRSSATILATGHGCLFGSTTNPSGATGTALSPPGDRGRLRRPSSSPVPSHGPRRRSDPRALKQRRPRRRLHMSSMPMPRFLFEHTQTASSHLGTLWLGDPFETILDLCRHSARGPHDRVPTVVAGGRRLSVEPVTDLIRHPAAHYRSVGSRLTSTAVPLSPALRRGNARSTGCMGEQTAGNR